MLSAVKLLAFDSMSATCEHDSCRDNIVVLQRCVLQYIWASVIYGQVLRQTLDILQYNGCVYSKLYSVVSMQHVLILPRVYQLSMFPPALFVTAWRFCPRVFG
jgi:hypothetical protein